MRELGDEIVINVMRRPVEETQAVVLSRKQIGKCTECIFPKAELIDLSNNALTSLSEIFGRFPAGWWFQLSHNAFFDRISPPCPTALGLLDIRGNSLSLDRLDAFSSTVIYRLNIDITADVTRRTLFQHMHVIWVLNDDFITSEEISAVTMGGTGGYGDKGDSDWFFGRTMNEREKDAVDVLNNHLPCKHAFSNQFRLDLVLDDYLQQAHLYNSQDVCGGTSGKGTMPIVCCECVLSLPHAVRLDVSVLLTTGILFKMPLELYVETLEMMLMPHGMTRKEVKQLSELPKFAKTALVSLIRRLCAREKDELQTHGCYMTPPFSSFRNRSNPAAATGSCSSMCISNRSSCAKSDEKEEKKLKSTAGCEPNASEIQHCVDPTALEKYVVESVAKANIAAEPLFPRKDAIGFRYLRKIREYLSSTYRNNDGHKEKVTIPFSEMEEDILAHLPDMPTLFTCPPSTSPQYRDWVSLAARHTIILMTRCPSCPPLTTSQRTKAHRDTHRELTPLLEAAEMTYEDLEIVTTGPALDGRKEAPRQVLSYGDAIPTGTPQQLVWHSGTSRPRNYPKPWEGRPSTANGIGGDGTGGQNGGERVYTAMSGRSVRTPGVGEDMCDEEAHESAGLEGSDGTQQKELQHSFSGALSEDGMSEATISQLLDVTYDDSGLLCMGSSSAPQAFQSGLWRSNDLVKPVGGYSSDSALEPCFLLAPVDEVEEGNRLRDSQVPWSDISRPPAILHPHSQIPVRQAKYSENREQDSDGMHEETITALNLSRLERQASFRRQDTDTCLRRQDSSASSYRTLTPQGSLSRQNSFGLTHSMTPLEKKLTKRDWTQLSETRRETRMWLRKFGKDLMASIMHRDLAECDPELATLMLAIKNADEKLLNVALEVAPNAAYQKHNAAESMKSVVETTTESLGVEIDPGTLKAQLLREMGTTRNVKRLEDSNIKNAVWNKMHEKRAKMQRENTLRIGGRVFSLNHLDKTRGKKSMTTTTKISRPSKIQWSSFARDPPAKEPEIFLTSTDADSNYSSHQCEDLTDDPSQHGSGSHGPSSSQMSSLDTAPIADKKKPSRLMPGINPTCVGAHGGTDGLTSGWNGTETVTQHLKDTMKYSDIYSLSNDIEWGPVGPAGKISATWYPCYPKKIYTLDPAAPVHAARRQMREKTLATNQAPAVCSTEQKLEESAAKKTKRVKIGPALDSTNAVSVKPKDYTNSKLKPVPPVLLEAIDGTQQHFYDGKSFGTRVLPFSNLVPATSTTVDVAENADTAAAAIGLTDTTSVSIPRPSVVGIDSDSVASYADDHEGDSDYDSLAMDATCTHSLGSTVPTKTPGSPLSMSVGDPLSSPLIFKPITAGSIYSAPSSARNSPGKPGPSNRSQRSHDGSLLPADGSQSALTAPNLSVSAPNLPPVIGGKRSVPKLSTKNMVVQLDPLSQRDASLHRTRTDRIESISVLKSAKHNLQLSRSFRQTIPHRFVAK